MFSGLHKTYPNLLLLSVPIIPTLAQPTIITHHHPWVFCFHPAPNPLSQYSQGDYFETAHQSMFFLCLKSSYEFSSMAFRIKSQIMTSWITTSFTIWPSSWSNFLLHYIPGSLTFLFFNMPSTLTLWAFAPAEPLSQVVLSPSSCMARFLLSLRSQLRPSTTPSHVISAH